MKKLCSFIAISLLTLTSHASVGLDTLQLPGSLHPVTVFYPSNSATASLQRGPFTLELAWQGQVVQDNGRLVVFSHGSGGSPWPLADLAHSLVYAGFVVATPEHEGDNYKDQSKVGPETWKLRPREMSQAIDTVQADPRFAQRIDFQQVGVYGTSAGGLTALTLAGGRWSPANFMRHCLAHIEEDFHACVGLAARLHGNFWDTITLAFARMAHRSRFNDETWNSHYDPRIKAVIASVPMAVPLDIASLAQPRTAVALVQAEQDAWLAPRFHSQVVLAACASCANIPNLPLAAHGTLFSPWPQDLAQSITPMLVDPPGFNRADIPIVYARMVQFFKDKLSAAQ
jgi:predicted dienelactone hydrolase